jgi:hypothetical protein
MMNTATIRRFLTVLSSKGEVERLGLYQLIKTAEASYWIRDIHTQLQIGSMLEEFPYPFHQAGTYYKAIYFHRQGDFDEARKLFEPVAESGPRHYRAKAFLGLGAIEQSCNNIAESFDYRLQACRLADPAILLEAQSGISVLRSIEGDHRGAIKHLEHLMPIARMIGPTPLYFDYLNSYAIELSEAGRLVEAQNVSRIVNASPFLSAYPQWHDTQNDINFKLYRNRSYISLFTNTYYNVVHIEPSKAPAELGAEPARIFNLQDWKKRMPKRANGDEKDEKNQVYELPNNPTERDVFLRIMHLASKEGISEKKLWKMLEAVEKITDEPDDQD